MSCVGRLTEIRMTLHRVPDGYLEVLWWNPGCVEPTIAPGHFCSGNPELTEARCDPRCLRWHPVERIEALHFTDDPAL